MEYYGENYGDIKCLWWQCKYYRKNNCQRWQNVVLNENEHIAVAVIFIENDKGEFLIQKTSKEKVGEFSSTDGHVDSGETPLAAIKREVNEELGINIDKDKIEEYGFLLYDKPLRYLYYLRKNIDLKDVHIQE